MNKYDYDYIFLAHYEGDDPGGGDPGGDDPGGDPTGGDPNKTFTQDDVNSILSREKKNWQAKNQKTLDQLKSLQNTASLTAKEKEALQNQISDLEKELLTKDELAARERKKLETSLTKERDAASEEAKTWRSRYTESRINTELTQAAVKHEAFNPKQILALLSPTAEIHEIMSEEGKGTGNYKVLVEVDSTNEKGETKRLRVTPDEAVKVLSEQDEFFNLFKGKGSGGTGGSNGQGENLDIAKIAKDPELYRQLRKEGKLKL